ncbi:TonB-dependent receptor [Croceicoccus gelatinilyticus]|uniref:TonB-dependent receptor n=1 Tax=Croceicoccus gelatinilyticus TaxID=2835536 RepID=UPI001BCF807C|nr:TonB-dependent receptor [Croceicoccus gelatinilyticus]MBS7669560.1 TonB-dependent receptor [Croceicoccus gelatinilyticus]
MFLRSKSVLLLGGASLALTSQVAFAQDAQTETAKTGGLNEIVVTARKREESVQDVPVAVTAMSEEMIQNRDITSIEKIAAATPNLNVGRASNGSSAQITLRGIGSSSTSIGIEQSVAIVVDGAYYGQGRVIDEGFFDLARVEVLKGPQALFFGKNATAGVISLTTNDPTYDWTGSIKAGYEFKANQYQLEGIISGPITDTLGIRLAARYSDMDGGYYDNVSTPQNYTTVDTAQGFGDVETLVSLPIEGPMPQQEEFLARATLKWEPTSDLTNTLKVTRNQNDTLNNSWNYVAYSCGNGTGFSQLTVYPCEKDFITHQNALPAEVAQTAPYGNDDGVPYNRYRSWGINNQLEYEMDTMTISSVTNWQRNNNSWLCNCNFQATDSVAGGMIFATENSTWEAFSQELRLTSVFDGPFNFMIGGLYQTTDRDFGQWGFYSDVRNSAAPRPDLVYAASEKISTTEGETIAIFGQVRFELMDGLELAAGGRYTDEKKDSYFAQEYVNPAFAVVYRDADDPLGTITANQKFKDFAPEVTLTYEPTPDILLYGAYKTAYKSGGFSNGGINSQFSPDPYGDLTFNPEEAEGFEVGIKSTILDNQLRANLTLFTYTVKDFQVDFFNSPVFAFNTLTADAKTQGVELELEYAPYAVPGLNLNAAVNYNDAKYDSFPEGPCYSGQTQAEGCNVITADGQIRQNLTGQPLSVAPEWTGVIGVNYETDIGSTLMMGFNANARYSDSYNPSGFANPIAIQDDYWTIDAGLRFGAADGNWQLALIGKNLTNEFYVTGVVDGPSSGTAAGGVTGVKADQLGFGTLPRTVKVELTKRF